jgi:hypothetical protein
LQVFQTVTGLLRAACDGLDGPMDAVLDDDCEKKIGGLADVVKSMSSFLAILWPKPKIDSLFLYLLFNAAFLSPNLMSGMTSRTIGDRSPATLFKS